MGLNTPPLIEMPTTICGHCSRDNYGSTDQTCRGCGAPVAVRPTSPPPPKKAPVIGRVPVPPPPPPSVGFVWG